MLSWAEAVNKNELNSSAVRKLVGFITVDFVSTQTYSASKAI
jgi:hypothetical protein